MGSKLMVLCSISAICLAIGLYALFREKPLEPLPKIEDEWWGGGERKNESTEVRPFTVDIPSELLFDLKKRLQSTRYFISLEKSEWEYGAKVKYMKEIIDYWLNKYSWGTHQQQINQYPHFKTDIDGISLHFVYVKPDKGTTQGKTVLPLLLLHGWPGSFYEFYKTIPLFTQITKNIGFEVIIPSLPGYGFSSAAKKKGLSTIHVAKIMHKLMVRLGFESYYVQGGDWGSDIGRKMALQFPRNVKGLHLNFILLPVHPKHPISTFLLGMVVPSWLESDPHEQEKAFKVGLLSRLILEEGGDTHIKATKPDTIGYGLNDSPAGLASYIIEKMFTTSGCPFDTLEGGCMEKHFTNDETFKNIMTYWSTGAVESMVKSVCPLNTSGRCMENHYTKDEVLTNIMLYWLTGSMPSAMRLYKDTVHDPHLLAFNTRPFTVPIGFAEFPFELFSPPKSWLKAICPNLISFTIMPRGGHFAALEQPKLLADDVRSFVLKVEKINQEKKAR